MRLEYQYQPAIGKGAACSRYRGCHFGRMMTVIID